MDPLVNIVLISQGRPEMLEQTLRSLANHTNVPYTLDLVFDEHVRYTDDVLSFPYGRDDCLRLRVWSTMPDSPLGVGGSKNLGANKAASDKGEYLYFSDNDIYFCPGWLTKLVSTYQVLAPCSGIRILGGRNHPFHLPTKHITSSSGYHARAFNALAGYSWLLRWETWEEFGPFPGNARGVRQSEDVAVGNRVKGAGFKVASIWPYVVIDCGKTDTFGNPVPGVDLINTSNTQLGGVDPSSILIK